MKKKLLAGLATALLSLGTATVAQANLIVNGSFEDPAIGGWQVFNTITGWTTPSGPGIEIQNNVAGSPYDGNQHVELDSYGNSAMQQTVSTVAGAWYNLQFAYSPRPNVSSESNGIEVLWNDTIIFAITGEVRGDTYWTLVDSNFIDPVLGTGSDSLVFRAFGTNDTLGGYIDAVSLDAAVDPVPEPASMLLLGSGLAGLAGMRRRRKA